LYLNGKVAAMRSCVVEIAGASYQCTGEISRGTLEGVQEQAGVSAEEFIAAL
jgi:hypothetical protein